MLHHPNQNLQDREAPINLKFCQKPEICIWFPNVVENERKSEYL